MSGTSAPPAIFCNNMHIVVTDFGVRIEFSEGVAPPPPKLEQENVPRLAVFVPIELAQNLCAAIQDTMARHKAAQTAKAAMTQPVKGMQ